MDVRNTTELLGELTWNSTSSGVGTIIRVFVLLYFPNDIR